jgi:hypothetical protein
MAEFKLARIRFTWNGTWLPGTAYNRDAIVQYNGKSYVCLIPNTSSTIFENDLNAPLPIWSLLIDGKQWNGAWASSTTYGVGDIVTFGGAVYICTTKNTSSSTFTADQNYWTTMVQNDKWEGAWTNNTVYGIGDIVSYGGIVYRCLVDHTSAGQLDATPNNWAVYDNGLNYKGNFTNSVNYKLNDIVKLNAELFICKNAHLSSNAFVPGNWQLWMPGESWSGTWSNAVMYQIGDIVSYGGYDYVSITTNNAGNIPPQTTDINWSTIATGYSFQQEWSASTTYKIGAVVTRRSQVFDATADNVNQDPTGGLAVAATYVPAGSSGTTIVVSGVYLIQIVAGMTVTGPGFTSGQTVISNTGNAYSATIVLNAPPDSTPSTMSFIGVNQGSWKLVTPGVAWKGFWAQGISFVFGDLTVWQNATYKCILAHTSTPGLRPDLDTGNTYWIVYLYHARRNAGQTTGDLTTNNNGSNIALPIGPNTYSLRATNNLPGWRYITPVANVYYVDTAVGVDSITYGRTYDQPWKTIAYACATLLAGTQNKNAEAFLLANKSFLITEMYQWMLYQVAQQISPFNSTSVFDATKTQRDAGYVIDAIIYDLARGGNSQTIAATLAYFNNNGTFYNSAVTLEMPYFIASLNYLASITQYVLNNTAVPVSYQLVNGIPAGSRIAQVINNSTAVSETGSTTPANGATINVSNYANIAWTLNGVANQQLNLVRGNTYYFYLSLAGQTFNIQTTSGGYVTAGSSGTTYTVTNSGSSSYTIGGATGNPTLTLTRGSTYYFTVSVSGHPFWIKTSLGIGTGNAYSSGVTNNGAESGTVTFTVPNDAPNTLYYNCQYHTVMAGIINVVSASVTPGYQWSQGITGNGSTVGTVTFTVPYSAPNVLYIQDTVQATLFTQLNIYDASATITNQPSAVSATSTLFSLLTTALTTQTTAALPPANSGLTATIFVKTGSYNESLPISVPENVAVVGDEIRGVVVQPKIIINTSTTQNTSTTFIVTSTANMYDQCPVQFAGTVFGGITIGRTYYVVGSSITATTFSISTTPGGAVLGLSTGGLGSMSVYGGDALKSMFLMRNGTGLRNMTLNGLLGTLGAQNAYQTQRPTGGSYVALDPGTGPNDTSVWIFRRSPYIQNVTTFGQGCVGMKIDGTLHNGGNKSMVSNDFTQIISDGIGIWCYGPDSKTEAVSVFSYYAYASYFAENGGRIRATNGNSSYGTYGVIAEGYDTTEVPATGVVFNRSSQVQANVQSSLGLNATLLKLAFSNSGSAYNTTTTNMLYYSNNLVNSNWSTDGNISLQQNSIAPTGNAEAWTLTSTTSTAGQGYVYQNVNIQPAAAVYSALTGINLSGSGTSATFNVNVTSTAYVVTVNNGGTGYVTTNQILINGATLGGVTGVNDLTITVASVAGSTILSVTSSGTVPSGASKTYFISTYVKQGSAPTIDVYALFSGSPGYSVGSHMTYTFATGLVTVSNTNNPSGYANGLLPTGYGVIPQITPGWYRIWMSVYDSTAQNNILQYRIYPRGYNGSAGNNVVYGNQVQTDNSSLSYYFETLGTQWTSYANFQVTGSGVGAVVIGDEIRGGGVFQSFVNSGGSGYLTSSNNAQGGTTTQLSLSQSDTNSASNYIGMRIFLNSGTGVGQYGYISTYNPTTKVAQVLQESFNNINISATSSSNSQFTLANGYNTTQLYVNQLIQFVPTYNTAIITQSSYGTTGVTGITGGITNALSIASTAVLQLNMPITFSGTGLPSANLTSNYTYYISSINPNGTDFSITTSIYGATWPLSTPGSYVNGSIIMTYPTNTGYLYGTNATVNMSVNQPVVFSGALIGGVSSATTYYINDIFDTNTFTLSNNLITLSCNATSSANNGITLASGTTSSLAVFNPIYFTNNPIGGLSTSKYYITKILNSASFTVASSLITTTATASALTSNLITVTSTAGFVVNQPIIFTGQTFGGIGVETVYYILAINNSVSFTISSQPSGSAINLSNGTGNLIVRTSPGDATLSTAGPSTFTGTTTNTKRLVSFGSGTMNATLSTSLFGGVTAGQNYYVASVGSNYVTVSINSNLSPVLSLTTGTGTMSIASPGWDHVIPGTPIPTSLDTTTVYYIEPRPIYDEPPFTQSSASIIAQSTGVNYIGIAYGNNYWIAIAGANNLAAGSSNGSTWTTITFPIVGTWSGIAYGNSYWVVIANGTNQALYSAAAGAGWKTSTMPYTTTWNQVAYGFGIFVALATGTNFTAYSTNYGATWSAGSGGLSGTWSGIAYGGGTFVGISSASGTTIYSTDGKTWTQGALPSSTTWSSIAYGNGRFVAISSASSASAYSFDGKTWYSSNLQISGTSITYGQGLFLVTISGGTSAYISDDGFTWKIKTVSSNTIGASSFGYIGTSGATQYNGVFVTVGGTNVCSNISAGTRPKGRATIVSNTITYASQWEAGSGYTSAPNVSFADPNATSIANVTARVSNGTLGNPTIPVRGIGYSVNSTYIAISGNGYANTYQTGYTLIVNNLTALPSPGANITIAGNPGVYKISSASIMFGTTTPNIEANLQINPNITTALSPADGTVVSIRSKYSQARLTNHDMLNIGFGNFVNSNYPNTPLLVTNAIAANQTVENNFGRVFYTSTDQDGNFKVGGLFGVQQSTGIITLSAANFGLSGLSSLALGGIAVGGSSVIITQFSTDATFAANSDSVIPTQKAIKSYISSRLSQGGSNTFTNQLVAGVVSFGNPNIITDQIPKGLPYSALQVKPRIKIQSVDGGLVALNFFMSHSWNVANQAQILGQSYTQNQA